MNTIIGSYLNNRTHPFTANPPKFTISISFRKYMSSANIPASKPVKTQSHRRSTCIHNMLLSCDQNKEQLVNMQQKCCCSPPMFQSPSSTSFTMHSTYGYCDII
eukprot:886090_1